MKRLLRLIALVFLLSLASIGIGLGGGVPIPASGRKENAIEIVAAYKANEEEDEINEIP
ncbi:hypothetical protein [Pedobacter nototheniae]|uniref:hypothetical protein n=1 Tax=Pedobacter nototheniae TaxID=2488994 RepID=UPI0029319C8A|nr:hypothetical protein [Pedobacter nototheniae]